MRDPRLVRQRQRHGDGLQQIDRGLERLWRERLFEIVEQLFERRPLEPLEHQVRLPLARGELELADVARLHDRRAPARHLAHQLAFAGERIEDGLTLVSRDVRIDPEHLDGDRLIPHEVGRPVDDAEAAFAGEIDDAVLAVDHPTNEVSGILHHPLPTRLS